MQDIVGLLYAGFLLGYHSKCFMLARATESKACLVLSLRLLDGASASNRLTDPLFLDAGRAVATEGVSTVAGPGAYGQCGR